MTGATPEDPNPAVSRDMNTHADDIELLLPWYAAGTLTPEETKRVEEALARDPSLAEKLAVTREEMGETIGLAESIPAPSPKVRDRVFDRIAQIEAARPVGFAGIGRKARESGFVGRLLDLVSGFAPRTLAYAGVAAALLIAVQAGVIGSMLTNRPGGTSYGTASGPGTVASVQDGTFALVRFGPNATADRISAALGEVGAAIVDGPRAGGLYRVRIASKTVSNEERDRLLAKLRDAKDVVASALPSP